jgi:hypothetical protein
MAALRNEVRYCHMNQAAGAADASAWRSGWRAPNIHLNELQAAFRPWMAHFDTVTACLSYAVYDTVSELGQQAFLVRLATDWWVCNQKR